MEHETESEPAAVDGTPDPESDDILVPEQTEHELTSTLHELRFNCSLCGKMAAAQALVGTVGPFEFKWVRMPIGWWLLTPATVESDQPCIGLQVRCDKCLRTGPMPELGKNRRRSRRRRRK